MNDIAGTWIDRRTGKNVIVRDAVIDGDTMVIISSIGNISPEIFGQYFVRMSEEDYGTTGITPEVSKDDLSAVINNGIDKDMQIKQEPIHNFSLDEPLPTQNTNNIQISNTEESKHNICSNTISNDNIIKKVFDKMNVEPEIIFSVNIEEWPINELKMLVNVLDIPFDEISNYIITQYLNKEVLSKYFSEYLQNALENNK